MIWTEFTKKYYNKVIVLNISFLFRFWKPAAEWGSIPAIFYASDSLWFDFFSPCPDSEPLDYTFMKYKYSMSLGSLWGQLLY